MTGWLLDTNVISELRRPRPEPRVVAFVAARPLEQLFVSAVTLAEIRFGIELVVDVSHRAALTDWLTHKGTVGRAVVGVLHICDDDGEELPAGQNGGVYFSDGKVFEYHNDPAKTAAGRNAKGWTTLGDIGYMDAEGYLYTRYIRGE